MRTVVVVLAVVLASGCEKSSQKLPAGGSSGGASFDGGTVGSGGASGGTASGGNSAPAGGTGGSAGGVSGGGAGTSGVAGNSATGGADGRPGGRPGGGADGAVAVADAAIGDGPADGDGDVEVDAGADGRLPGTVNPFVYVGVNASTEIRIFELDLTTGNLMPRGMATSGPSAHYIAFHPTGRFLYAVSEVNAGRVFAFSIDHSTGALTPLNDVPSGGNLPAHLSVHKSGKFVMVANYSSGHAATFPVMADGRLGSAVAPTAAGALAHMIVDDGQSGGFVFVPSKGDNRTSQFKFDQTTGTLTPNSPPFVAQAGSPRHMTFHRSGRFAFVLTEAGRSVVSYRYDSATGLLSDGAALVAAPSGNGAHILMHPTAPFLYASLREYNSIALFVVNADGRLQGPSHLRDQINVPWDFDIDPSGRYMVVGNHGSDTVRVFRIDPQTGMLTPTSGNGAAGLKPRCVAILRR